MATLNDLYLDDDGFIACGLPQDSKEWDKLVTQLFQDWKQKTSWIDVRDRLPVQGREVLIADAKYKNYKGIGSYTKQNGWEIGGSNYWQPTHWMEIPELKSDVE